MAEDPSEIDPMKAAADQEVEETAAVARGVVPKRATPDETAAAEREIDAAANVSPAASVGDAAADVSPAASVGDAAADVGPLASVGDADPTEETLRAEPRPESAASVPSRAPGRSVSSQEHTWAIAAHASAALIAVMPLPFANVVGPLCVWLAKKESSGWVREHARAALNFQLTMSLAGVLAAASIWVSLGLIVIPIVVIADIVYTIKAITQAGDNREAVYPSWSLELVK